VSVNTGIYYITTRYETPPRRFYFVYRSSFGRSNLVGHIILWPLLNFILISYDRYIIIIIYLHTLYLTLFVSLFPDYIVSAIPLGWLPSLLAIASVAHTHTPISHTIIIISTKIQKLYYHHWLQFEFCRDNNDCTSNYYCAKLTVLYRADNNQQQHRSELANIFLN
jgi:hypothetical protein